MQVVLSWQIEWPLAIHSTHKGDWVPFLSQYIPHRRTLCRKVDPLWPLMIILVLTIVGSEVTMHSSKLPVQANQATVGKNPFVIFVPIVGIFSYMFVAKGVNFS